MDLQTVLFAPFVRVANAYSKVVKSLMWYTPRSHAFNFVRARLYPVSAWRVYNAYTQKKPINPKLIG